MTKERIAVAPHMLRWALERAGLEAADLAKKFPTLDQWLSGELQPTLKKLEDFAKTVHMPFGYLFLPEPLIESLPVADFRTKTAQLPHRPSLNLLETVYSCQQRQDWYRDYARLGDFTPLSFVGSVTTKADPAQVTVSMREVLGFPLAEQQAQPNWESALRLFRTKVEEAGILLMANGVVGSNTHRKLSVEEFRGFALSDPLAPLIFINNADSKAAQMFTLAHELGHLWAGESGISDTQAGHASETWCNAVAAEFLMPLSATRKAYHKNKDASLEEQLQPLARLFKVSTLVVLRRLWEAGFIDKESFWEHYQKISAHTKARGTASGGGDFYKTLTTRTGKRFMQALIPHTLEGHTLFRDAFQLLGVNKTTILYKAAAKLGIHP